MKSSLKYSSVCPLLLVMQWSALENFKWADLYSLTISIKSSRQCRLARGGRQGGGNPSQELWLRQNNRSDKRLEVGIITESHHGWSPCEGGFWYPLQRTCSLHGVEQANCLWGRIMVHYSLFFQISILPFSAVSTWDSLKRWCCPHLSRLISREDVEKKCYLWYRVAILAFLVFPLLRIPIPQEFIINSVALLWKLTSGATKSGKPFGLDQAWIFSPLHPAHQLGTAPTPTLQDEVAKD